MTIFEDCAVMWSPGQPPSGELKKSVKWWRSPVSLVREFLKRDYRGGSVLIEGDGEFLTIHVDGESYQSLISENGYRVRVIGSPNGTQVYVNDSLVNTPIRKRMK